LKLTVLTRNEIGTYYKDYRKVTLAHYLEAKSVELLNLFCCDKRPS